jgi:dTDP-4-amino-4,6-dideoxygalactose transaminase
MNEKLAIDGGPRAKTTPTIPMYPGGLDIGDAEKAQVLEVLDRKYLFRYYGPQDVPSKVNAFEKAFAAYMGAKHCLAVTNCTSALIDALVAVGVGPGSEVIVNGYTFFASCAAIVAAKAVPVICEIDDSLTMDPADLEKKITKHTRAVICVHMRGAPCDMDRIVAICRKHNIKLIEDVAQACGGAYKGRRLGTFGDIGCFSFQYHKIITAGEGGACVTNDPLLYNRLMGYHDTAACWRPDRFGEERYQGELFCGVNYRMSELTGAVMLAQLGRLDGLLARMRANRKRIMDQIRGLKGLTFRRLNDEAGDTAICLMFSVNDRAKLTQFVTALQAEGVAAAGVFNKGIPDWHIYSHWKHVLSQATPTAEGCPYRCPHYTGDAPAHYSADMCPNTNALLAGMVHLDIPSQLTDADCDMIAKGIRKVAEALL